VHVVMATMSRIVSVKLAAVKEKAQARASPPRETLHYRRFQTMFQEPLPKVLAPETPIERLLKHQSKCEPAPFGGHYYFA
jgi:hypothetical protein